MTVFEAPQPRRDHKSGGKPLVAGPRSPSKALESGHRIDGDVRAVLGPRLGHDFSRIPAHTDTVRTLQRTAGNSAVVGYLERWASHPQQASNDFSSALVHSDESAGRSAEALSAASYTRGEHSGFSRGNYHSDTPVGNGLFAPEVGQIVKARRADHIGHAAVRRPIIGLSTDLAEREADEMAERVMSTAVGPVKPAHMPDHGDSGVRALSPQERAIFEPGFGHDLSRVRLHNDSMAQDSARALSAHAYTVGEHVFGGASLTAGTAQGLRLLAHELAHVVQADRTAGAPIVRRVSFGANGALSPQRQAVVQAAATIAEGVVTSRDFAQKWDRFWSGSPITPRPSLEAYQAAVRKRVVHDMDTSTVSDVRALVFEERDLPLERQTAAATNLGSINTYVRQFAVDQGIDSMVMLLLHESIHGAGVPMGPGKYFEAPLHGFEAEAGFPLVMGGADILTIKQVRRGDYHVDVTVTYNLRSIDLPLSKDIEIHAVSTETGDILLQEEPDTTRQPVRHRLASRLGTGTWVWHARYVGVAPVTIRIKDASEASIMASRQFIPNPRCVLGVSGAHCEATDQVAAEPTTTERRK